MTIRRATDADLDGLVKLARQEHALSQMSDTPFDEAVCRVNFTGAVRSMNSAVFVSETEKGLTGLIAGMSQQNLHNKFCTVYELLWFSTDGSGLRLLKALREWGARMRAKAVVVHNYAGIVQMDRFNRVMERVGFAPMGASFVAKLEN
jgi:hypothetical protein